jgi:hypothetical protein
MNIPITKRVQQGGGKKGCGCPSGCNCGKTPAKALSDLKGAAAQGKLDDSPEFKALVESAPAVAKMWGPAKRKYGAKAVAKMGCYGKKK